MTATSSATLGKDLQDLLNMAREKFIAGEYPAAENILGQILLRDNRIPEVFQMLATIFYNRGQFNKAIKTFRRALEIDPNYTDASVGLSIILNDLGHYEEGKKIFHEAQAMLERRNSKTDPFINEKIARKHEELADLYFQYQRFHEALENLNKAIKLSSRRAEISLRVAECYVKLRDSDKAIRELQTIVREYPHYIPARTKLGIILYNMNKVAEAVGQWEAILNREPTHPEALRYLRMAQNAGFTDLQM